MTKPRSGGAPTPTPPATTTSSNNNSQTTDEDDDDDGAVNKVDVVVTTTTEEDTHRAFWGTLSNMMVRLVSFGCTQIVFRLLKDDIAALGQASIPLELLLTTTLFTSREGFRLSLTKQRPPPPQQPTTHARSLCDRLNDYFSVLP